MSIEKRLADSLRELVDNLVDEDLVNAKAALAAYDAAQREGVAERKPLGEKCQIIEVEEIGNLLLAKVHYPESLSFKELEILLYEGVTATQLVNATRIDSRFRDFGFKLLAKFVPTPEGWNLAKKCAAGIQAGKAATEGENKLRFWCWFSPNERKDEAQRATGRWQSEYDDLHAACEFARISGAVGRVCVSSENTENPMPPDLFQIDNTEFEVFHVYKEPEGAYMYCAYRLTE